MAFTAWGNWAGYVAYLGDERTAEVYTGETSASHPNFTVKLGTVGSILLASLGSVYTPASVTDHTASTFPASVQTAGYALVTELLGVGGKGRADSIRLEADNARKFLTDARNDSMYIPEFTKQSATSTDTDGGSNIRISSPSGLTFDSDTESDTGAAWYVRDLPI